MKGEGQPLFKGCPRNTGHRRLPHPTFILVIIVVIGAMLLPVASTWAQTGTAWHLADIEAPAAWGRLNELPDLESPQPVVVSIIDSGVDADHPDLHARVLAGRNFAKDTSPTDTTDENGHGTLIAGIISTITTSDINLARLGTGIRLPIYILPVKVLDNRLATSIRDVVDAIHWSVDWRGADGERVRVINLSLGATLGKPPQLLSDAVQYARDQGVLIVAAAGNGWGSAANFYPAAFDSVLSVGASGEDHRLLATSHTGADFIAPGENILSTAPGGKYSRGTGTSYATPFITAAAAMLWTAYPNLTVDEVVAALSNGQHRFACDGITVAANNTPGNGRPLRAGQTLQSDECSSFSLADVLGL